MTTLILDLPLPPSVNNLFHNVPGKGRRKARVYHAWEQRAYDGLWTQKPRGGFPLFSYNFAIRIEIPLRMPGDADGRIKPIPDFLKDAGIILDDRYMTAVSCRRSADIRPGRCRVEISDEPVPDLLEAA